MKPLAIGMIAAFGATTASAQDWDLSLTPYLWGAGIDGTLGIGPRSADVSVDFEDIVNVLDGAALLRFEAQTDEHGFLVDLTFLSLEESEARGALGGRIGVEIDTLILEGAYFRALGERHGIEFGVRYWDFESTLIPTVLQAATSRRTWTDGFVGFRATFDLSTEWVSLLRVNFGAGGADLSGGLQLDFRRQFERGNSLDLGLRVLDLDYDQGDNQAAMGMNIAFQGLTIGYTFDL